MKDRMKKVIKHSLQVVAFLAVLVLVFYFLSPIFVPKDNTKEAGIDNQRAKGYLAEPKNTLDMIFIGDSETYATFIPLKIYEECGYTSFNCGTAKQVVSYTKNTLLDVFKHQRPKVVVLEANCLFRKDKPSEKLIGKLNDKFSIFEYHNRWKTLTKNDFTDSPQYTHTELNKGYKFNISVDAADATRYMKVYNQKIEISAENKKTLKQIKMFCEDNGATLLLCSAPSTKNWNNAKHREMTRVANLLDIDYLDLNMFAKEIKIDWEKDTRDKGDHLNYFGALKSTLYYADYLKSTGLLKSHKGDEKFAQWDKDVKRFNKAVKKKLNGGEVKIKKPDSKDTATAVYSYKNASGRKGAKNKIESTTALNEKTTEVNTLSNLDEQNEKETEKSTSDVSTTGEGVTLGETDLTEYGSNTDEQEKGESPNDETVFETDVIAGQEIQKDENVVNTEAFGIIHKNN